MERDCLQLLWGNDTLQMCNSASLKALFATGIVCIVLLTLSVLLLFLSLFGVVWKAREIKRYLHEHVISEEERSYSLPSSELTKRISEDPADKISCVSAGGNENNIPSNIKEYDKEELGIIQLGNSKEVSVENTVDELKGSVDIVSPTLSKVDQCASALDISDSTSKAIKKKCGGFQEYEEMEIHSVMLENSHNDIKKTNKTKDDIPFYEEIQNISHDHKSAAKEGRRSSTKMIKQRNSISITSDAKKAPVYSVVNSKMKKNKKASKSGRESQCDEDLKPEESDAVVETPIYSVVDKSKKTKRKENLNGAVNAPKNSGVTSEVEALGTPLYSVVNLELKKSRKARKGTEQGEEKEEDESREDAVLNEDAGATPMYAVVNLKAKKSRRASNEGLKLEESESAEHSESSSDEGTNKALLDTNKS